MKEWWNQRPKVFRIWAIASASWIAAVFLFVMMIDPNSLGTDLIFELKNFNPGASFAIMFLLLIVLPGGIGGGIWVYCRFLRKPAAATDEGDEN